MAAIVTNRGKKILLDGTGTWASTLKVVLVKATNDFVADTNFLTGEAYTLDELQNCNGYTGGHNGTGRKAITATIVEDDANDRVDLKADALTWTEIGPSVGNEAIGAVLIIKQGASDAASEVIARIDLTTPVVPNGGDITIKWDNQVGAGAVVRLS